MFLPRCTEMNIMASTWLRLQMQYLGGVRMSRVIVILSLLAVAFIFFQWFRGPSRGIIRYRDVPVNHRMTNQEIDDYIYAMQDTRPQDCRIDHSNFFTTFKPKISIIVDFHNAQFYNLKLTLESILRHTSSSRYLEIILLDDGSSHAAIRQHAADILQTEKFMKVRAFRSEEFHGRGSTRLKATHVAEGDILVFVSSDVVVNVGWLEPLVVGVLENTNTIVTSHEDNFLDDKRFYQVDDTFVSTFSWPLSTIYMESKETSKLLKTPIMRGEVVAVAKSFLESLGNYDEGLKEGGGHDLELSVRTWLCGGEVMTSVCSRVATHHALKPPVVTNHDNFRRIAELWLGDFKNIAYKQGRVHSELTADDNLEVKIRKKYVTEKKSLYCRSFDWYLSDVMGIVPPHEDMVHHGKLRVSATYCAKQSKTIENELTLVLCRPYMYDKSMIFTLDSSGRIKNGELCLMGTSGNSRVMLSQCQLENKLQLWKYSDTGLITSQVFKESCLKQITTLNSEARLHEHHIQLSACSKNGNQKQKWTFINY